MISKEEIDASSVRLQLTECCLSINCSEIRPIAVIICRSKQNLNLHSMHIANVSSNSKDVIHNFKDAMQLHNDAAKDLVRIFK